MFSYLKQRRSEVYINQIKSPPGRSQVWTLVLSYSVTNRLRLVVTRWGLKCGKVAGVEPSLRGQ